MLKQVLGLALVVGGLSAVPPTASAANIRCDTCATDLNFREQALVQGQGTHNVYNLLDNTIQTWQVPKQDTGTDPWRVSQKPLVTRAAAQPPVRVATSPQAVTELDRAHRVFVSGGYTLKPIINVPVGIVNVPSAQSRTAIDVLSDFNLRSMLASGVANSGVYSTVVGTNLATALADLLAVAASPLGLKQQAGVTFRLIMADGSTVDFKISLDATNGEYINGSARTPGGQLIPDNINQVQGDWTSAGGDSLEGMAGYMGSLGASMNYIGAGGVTRIACVSAGDTRVCTVYRQ
ncbi:hypothetical protein [Xanthomonas campestris]|uniref:hypothetical protein n=1 Tax=Xanthomonas campestris TaxID=339 RepID=UPI003CE6E65E